MLGWSIVWVSIFEMHNIYGVRCTSIPGDYTVLTNMVITCWLLISITTAGTKSSQYANLWTNGVAGVPNSIPEIADNIKNKKGTNKTCQYSNDRLPEDRSTANT